jgi:hypothetical protein
MPATNGPSWNLLAAKLGVGRQQYGLPLRRVQPEILETVTGKELVFLAKRVVKPEGEGVS